MASSDVWCGQTNATNIECYSKSSRDDDKKTTKCRADLNQLVPFKYTWAWDKYLSTSNSARASSAGIFAQQNDKQHVSASVDSLRPDSP